MPVIQTIGRAKGAASPARRSLVLLLAVLLFACPKPEPLTLVYWQTSYYADRWDVMISGIRYHLDKHPELAADARNAARMYGRLAFAYGASGMSRQARRWAGRSIRLSVAGVRASVEVPSGFDPEPARAARRKRLQEVTSKQEQSARKLANEQFVARAKAEAVERERQNHAALQQQELHIREELEQLERIEGE